MVYNPTNGREKRRRRDMSGLDRVRLDEFHVKPLKQSTITGGFYSRNNTRRTPIYHSRAVITLPKINFGEDE